MDGVSTAVGLIATGIKVIRLINSALEDVKNAPEEIQTLRDRLDDVDMLLQDLQNRWEQGFFQSAQDLASLERLGRRAQKCVDEISAFVDKTWKVTKDGEAKVDTIRWLTRGNKLETLSRKLDKLEHALSAIMSLVVSYVFVCWSLRSAALMRVCAQAITSPTR